MVSVHMPLSRDVYKRQVHGKRKYSYKVNFTLAAHICRIYLRLHTETDSDVYKRQIITSTGRTISNTFTFLLLPIYNSALFIVTQKTIFRHLYFLLYFHFFTVIILCEFTKKKENLNEYFQHSDCSDRNVRDLHEMCIRDRLYVLVFAFSL